MVPAKFKDCIPASGKSPWNPSQRALAKVPIHMPPPTVCNCCGHPVEVNHHYFIYGRDYGDWPWMYCCTACDARVGMHPFTNIPLGTLADSITREARKLAKEPFDRLWHQCYMKRGQAYARMARFMKIPDSECHFGLFDVQQCELAHQWATEQLRKGKPNPRLLGEKHATESGKIAAIRNKLRKEINRTVGNYRDYIKDDHD